VNKINCGICNNNFNKLRYNSKYCSKICSIIAKKNSIKKYHQSKEVRERKKVYYRKWLKTTKGKEHIKRRNDEAINNPEKYKKLIENNKVWLKKLNTRNFKDENNNFLTNQQVKKILSNNRKNKKNRKKVA
tara:strand:- start:1070 stop:1462 length:393 start_codon:yes stop_codon:yes gene_type:complete